MLKTRIDWSSLRLIVACKPIDVDDHRKYRLMTMKPRAAVSALYSSPQQNKRRYIHDIKAGAKSSVIDPRWWLTRLLSLTRGVPTSTVAAGGRRSLHSRVCGRRTCSTRLLYGYWLRLIRRRMSSSSVTCQMSLPPDLRTEPAADSRLPASESIRAVLFILADSQAQRIFSKFSGQAAMQRHSCLCVYSLLQSVEWSLVVITTSTCFHGHLDKSETARKIWVTRMRGKVQRVLCITLFHRQKTVAKKRNKKEKKKYIQYNQNKFNI